MKAQRNWTEKLLLIVRKGQMYGVLLLLFAVLCIGSAYMYEKSDDWTRTLGHNYDLFGNNRKIRILYLGMADGISETEETEERKSCDLRSKGQSLEESYFLLKRADRRYDLLYVYLTVDAGWVSVHDEENGGTSVVKTGNVLQTEEEQYLRKIIAYCGDRGIELILHAPPL